MRSADRSCKTSRLTAKEFADSISNHYQTQTISADNGGSGWMAAPGLPVTLAASLCVTRDVQGLRQVTLPQALSSTQISVPLLHTVVCQLRRAVCEETAELSVVTSGSPCGCTYLHIHHYRVRLCTVHISHAMYSTRNTQRLCQYSRPRHSLLSYC